MAIYSDNEVSYIGCVLGERSHMWLDGMEDVYAVVWDDETGKVKTVKTGYYGIDGNNLMGMYHEVDVTPETTRKVLRALKAEAVKSYAESVKAEKEAIKKGVEAVVIRGRKIPKGTKLSVFWVGERPTYRSRQYDFMNETELIAGAYDENGNKVWIKAEYLKRTDRPKSPVASERKKYIKEYVRQAARKYPEARLMTLSRETGAA